MHHFCRFFGSEKMDKKEGKRSLSGQNIDLLGECADLLNALRLTSASDYKELAKTINVSESTVKRQVAKLKNAGIVERIGSKKTGHWKVLEANVKQLENNENNANNAIKGQNNGLKAQKGALLPENDPINDLLTCFCDLLNALRAKPASDYLELAETLGVSQSTIKRRVTKLKKAGILERIGSRKTGHWIILTDGKNADE
ncbi:MAG: winged helix-turn-helix transcriptional regulator [Verrucomicrobiae bacterium]|nr:winged helix-turn-helix transcriptional regulator [Verrucomicrobiae bacterium]